MKQPLRTNNAKPEWKLTHFRMTRVDVTNQVVHVFFSPVHHRCIYIDKRPSVCERG